MSGGKSGRRRGLGAFCLSRSTGWGSLERPAAVSASETEKGGGSNYPRGHYSARIVGNPGMGAEELWVAVVAPLGERSVGGQFSRLKARMSRARWILSSIMKLAA